MSLWTYRPPLEIPLLESLNFFLYCLTDFVVLGISQGAQRCCATALLDIVYWGLQALPEVWMDH